MAVAAWCGAPYRFALFFAFGGATLFGDAARLAFFFVAGRGFFRFSFGFGGKASTDSTTCGAGTAGISSWSTAPDSNCGR